MYKRGRNMAMSDLYCSECGCHMTVPRSYKNTREKGHKKKLWCYQCKKEVNFIEVREKDFILTHVI